MSQLQDQLDEILRQKQTYLKPENLRQGITAYGIEGQMTSENMWLPKYASEGNYYLLSFVNNDGNFDVNTICGYGGFRLVKFNSDDKWYLFDVRMNKPKQITNDIPNTTDYSNYLLGYNDTDVYIIHAKPTINGFKIYKINISTGEVEEKLSITGSNNALVTPILNSMERMITKDFVFATYGGSYKGYLYKYDIDSNSLITLKTFTGWADGGFSDGYSGNVQIIGNLIYFIGGDSDKTLIQYDLSSNNSKSWGMDDIGPKSECIRGMSNDGNYIFIDDKAYNWDKDGGIGAEMFTTPFTDTNSLHRINWLSNTLCVYNGTKRLYSYNEETHEFVELVNQDLYYPQVSTTYKDVIVGYEFLGNNYYFNTGHSIITDADIIEGHYARDQYNQTVQGSMPELGEVVISPSIEQQTMSAGHVKSITVKPVTYEIDSDIKPENIRYGVNILGIAGTLEQDVAESVMSQEEYQACLSVANNILGEQSTETTTGLEEVLE